MSATKHAFLLTPGKTISLSLCFSLFSSASCQNWPATDTHLSEIPARFVKLDQNGTPVSDDSAWACIKDLNSNLVWEVKTPANRHHTYSWYSAANSNNGGFAGYKNQGNCPEACDTQSYTLAVRQNQICGSSLWRLPSREELRSLVDYSRPFPGPAIDTNYFPNTVAQFYWSATADVNDPDSAWGIGFTFGFDYAYFKSDHAYVRLVADHQRP